MLRVALIASADCQCLGVPFDKRPDCGYTFGSNIPLGANI